jgi:hypothetical protein
MEERENSLAEIFRNEIFLACPKRKKRPSATGFPVNRAPDSLRQPTDIICKFGFIILLCDDMVKPY